ncbi:MAG: ABC transporter substrate-binding protein, partial [Clostridia bacterium]|nr:ABC transporter substrate-binding protein [Clostridia bacterium]
NNFTFGNELTVSAPEINGLWKMALLPGTVQEDGTVDHSTQLSCSGTVMFRNARNIENTWEFIKWWTSRDAQVDYSRQIEAALGRSGRWTSANLEAMEGIAWSREELSVLMDQLEYARALPEVAGGYYTGRSVNNAVRSVVNSNTAPKETLYEYVKDINEEITIKRRELGLD